MISLSYILDFIFSGKNEVFILKNERLTSLLRLTGVIKGSLRLLIVLMMIIVLVEPMYLWIVIISFLSGIQSLGLMFLNKHENIVAYTMNIFLSSTLTLLVSLFCFLFELSYGPLIVGVFVLLVSVLHAIVIVKPKWSSSRKYYLTDSPLSFYLTSHLMTAHNDVFGLLVMYGAGPATYAIYGISLKFIRTPLNLLYSTINNMLISGNWKQIGIFRNMILFRILASLLVTFMFLSGAQLIIIEKVQFSWTLLGLLLFTVTEVSQVYIFGKWIERSQLNFIKERLIGLIFVILAATPFVLDSVNFLALVIPYIYWNERILNQLRSLQVSREE